MDDIGDDIGDKYDIYMVVNRFGVLISSCCNSIIYQFNHQGNLLKRAGSPSEECNCISSLSCPIVCGIDSDGNILVADYGNDSFQLYDCNKC